MFFFLGVGGLAGHIQNQYNTGFWELVRKGGKIEMEAQEILKVLNS